ncbi:hypothetical protein [Pseudoxanthomonas mexicana]
MYLSGRFMGLRGSAQLTYVGLGYIGGDAPAGGDPDDPDGRAKIINVPSRVRIMVYERSTMRCVGRAVSDADGTWRVEYLSLDFVYTVIGFDDRGLVNAAIQDWIVPAAMV